MFVSAAEIRSLVDTGEFTEGPRSVFPLPTPDCERASPALSLDSAVDLELLGDWIKHVPPGLEEKRNRETAVTGRHLMSVGP